MKRQTFHVEKNNRSAMRLCMLIYFLALKFSTGMQEMMFLHEQGYYYAEWKGTIMTPT